MKTFLIVLVLAAAVGGYFYWAKVVNGAVGNLNIYQGGVEVGRGAEKISGKTGTEIKKGDVVKVADNSRISIILKDGSIVRFEAGSEVQILNIQYESGQIKDASFKLLSGKMWSQVNPLGGAGNFQVETPTTVASVRGTAFYVGYFDEASHFWVNVGKVGIALLDNTNNEKILIKGDFIKLGDGSLAADFAKDPIQTLKETIGEWIIFNVGEDANSEDVKETKKEEVSESETPANSGFEMPQIEKRTLKSVFISAENLALAKGERTKLTVKGEYSDGVTEEIPAEKVAWTKISGNGNIGADGYFASDVAGRFFISINIQNVPSNQIVIQVR